jgi:hypothetical protein
MRVDSKVSESVWIGIRYRWARKSEPNRSTSIHLKSFIKPVGPETRLKPPVPVFLGPVYPVWAGFEFFVQPYAQPCILQPLFTIYQLLRP